MQIYQVNNNYNKYNNSFKAITITPAEKEKAESIVQSIARNKVSNPRLDKSLWEIFQPHILEEAQEKTNYFYIFDDVFSDLCFKYSELIKDIKENGLGLQYLLDNINTFTKKDESRKWQRNTVSLDAPLKNSESETRTHYTLITEDHLPVPSVSEYNMEATKKLDSLLDEVPLSTTEERRFNKKRKGTSNRQIAQDEGVSERTIETSMMKARLKIQLKTGCLEQKYIDKALEIKKALNLDISDEMIIEAFVNEPDVYYMPIETIKSNLLKGATLLNCQIDLYAKSVAKNLNMILMKPETINSNIEQTSELLGLPKATVTEMALTISNYFYQKPETLYNNFLQLEELFKRPKTDILEALIKKPYILCLKIDTIKKKINDIANIFNCTFEEAAETVLKNPDALKYTPQKISQKKEMKEYYLLTTGNKSTKAQIVTTINQSEECLMNGILTYIFTGKKEQYTQEGKKFIENYIQSLNDDIYEYNIPEGKAAYSLVEYLSKLSMKIKGKNIFKINIVKDYSPIISDLNKNFNIPRKELTNVISKNPIILYKNQKIIKNNIDNIKNTLHCNRNEAAMVAFKRPKFIYGEQQETNEYLQNFAKQFDCTIEEISNNLITHPELITIGFDTWQRKNAIKKYYFKVTNYQYKNSDLCSTTAIVSDKYYYAGILLKLILDKVGQCNIKGERMLKEHINSLDKNQLYEYSLPQAEITESIIQYITNLSEEILGKNVFEFNIVAA